MRDLAPLLAAEGMTPVRLAATAARMARARVALEDSVAALLGYRAEIYPEGYCRLAPDVFHAVPDEIGLRALARIVSCIGGRDYPPRMDRLERLYAVLCGDVAALGGGRTLSGCRVLMRRGAILICREPAAASERLPARGEVLWDGRFRLRFASSGGAAQVRRLGREGWCVAVAEMPALRRIAIPAVVRSSLPSIWSGDRLLAAPHLRYRCRRGGGGAAASRAVVAFMPRRPLVPAHFGAIFTLQEGASTLFN